MDNEKLSYIADIENVGSFNDYEITDKFRSPKLFQMILDLHIKRKADFVIHEGDMTVLFNMLGDRYHCANNKKFKGKLHVFSHVARNAKAWLEKHGSVQIPEKQVRLNPSRWNGNEYDLDSTTDTDELGHMSVIDINSAFWQIARKKGYISKKVFEAYSEDDFKVVRLASLSVLGREKRYQVYKQGKPVGVWIGKKEDKELQLIFLDIRTTCYRYMDEIYEKLYAYSPRSVAGYKTDAIYFRFNPDTYRIVDDYLTERELDFKVKWTLPIIDWYYRNRFIEKEQHEFMRNLIIKAKK